MPIPLSCPHCRGFFRVTRQQAGCKVRCPDCGGTFRVPPDEEEEPSRGEAMVPELAPAAPPPLPAVEHGSAELEEESDFEDGAAAWSTSPPIAMHPLPLPWMIGGVTLILVLLAGLGATAVWLLKPARHSPPSPTTVVAPVHHAEAPVDVLPAKNVASAPEKRAKEPAPKKREEAPAKKADNPNPANN